LIVAIAHANSPAQKLVAAAGVALPADQHSSHNPLRQLAQTKQITAHPKSKRSERLVTRNFADKYQEHLIRNLELFP